MSTQHALKLSDLDDDLSSVEAMTVECPNCDPDSPIASPRKDCLVCKGTGSVSTSLCEIVKELRSARQEASRVERRADDEDLFLEY